MQKLEDGIYLAAYLPSALISVRPGYKHYGQLQRAKCMFLLGKVSARLVSELALSTAFLTLLKKQGPEKRSHKGGSMGEFRK